MSEETKPKRIRSHTLRDYTVTLVNGATLQIQSDDLRNARKAANERYGADVVSSVDYATGSRRSNAWPDHTSTQRSKDFHNQRRAKLDKIATDNGWKSWYDYESAVLKEVVDISTGS